ncbi:hypothetical protein IMG5_141810 [Ichthyophthirius multifiliis]|uniref:Uncharacterized protein n=1 Tax=Ichthyophthirius multifiliis TaxID=5932 RepID=G0QXE2_ICHMU|nr:hypothetical protein IMG5_141810 [Ichthyophthirius multifiliis]EGR30111.1 hypothetical protein IMG5_141810 [Ichthyophthirius multifiliis]|eukprot:XP_004031347.1 hypothetical protein IMG5_141810 [Ichthyophthirius multifiliis]
MSENQDLYSNQFYEINNQQHQNQIDRVEEEEQINYQYNNQQNLEDEYEIEKDDDFPEYANEQNKRLNEIIIKKRNLIKDIQNKFEEKSERTKVLKEHLKNVQYELLNTKALIDTKNKEIETEDHIKQITERQIGRIQSEMVILEKRTIEQQEKLNDFQNQIFRGNEKLDQFKLEMNWNQEELEQWALAARQKEEDNLTLEKYKRADEVKTKELNLAIEKLTQGLGLKQQELENEITETQATQIELDKTAEEFKKQHNDRHKLFLQWQEVTEIISKRDIQIRQEGENFARTKIEIKQNKDGLEEKKKILKEEIDNNKKIQMANEFIQRQNIQQIQENKNINEILINKKAEVEILKNQVSDFASNLQNKKNRISVLNQELLAKKQRLTIAQKKYQNNQVKIINEQQIAQIYEQNKNLAEQKYKQFEKERNEIEREIKSQKDILFKNTQDLFKLREQEANSYGEIQGNIAACRNLQSHIQKLNQEFQRQQELLYNVEYQIQLMERKVARAKGERTLEEKKDLENEIEQAEKIFNKVQKDNIELNESLKKLDDEIRQVKKKLELIVSENQKFSSLIEELILENDMTYQDLNKVIRNKEEILVQHDTMKLEIKKIQEYLNGAASKVFDLENTVYQIEMSMQEREKEIQVHKDVLMTEHKSSEDERHKIAVELAERKNKVKNLKIKYESLVQKNKGSNGQVDNVHEHSQAYYVIKAAQEREELQRKGDELNANILKSEKELIALENTLSHLKNRNSKYRDSFLNKGITIEDKQYLEGLEEQCRAASQNLFKKRDILQKLQKEYELDKRRLLEYYNKTQLLNQRQQQTQQIIDKYMKDIDNQQYKIQRAEQGYNRSILKIQQKKINIDNKNNPYIKQLKYEIEVNKTKTLLSSLYTLSQDIPEISVLIDQVLKEKKLTLPSKAPSSIDINSQQSIGSVHSQNSIKSNIFSQ